MNGLTIVLGFAVFVGITVASKTLAIAVIEKYPIFNQNILQHLQRSAIETSIMISIQSVLDAVIHVQAISIYWVGKKLFAIFPAVWHAFVIRATIA